MFVTYTAVVFGIAVSFIVYVQRVTTGSQRCFPLQVTLTPWSRVFSEKLTGPQLVKEVTTFYETRGSITAFTSARHVSLSWARKIQSLTPHPTSWRSILILFSHLRLGLPSVLFPSVFPIKILYVPFLSPILTTCHAHLILLDLITWITFGEEFRS